jgi:hypothetical protein
MHPYRPAANSTERTRGICIHTHPCLSHSTGACLQAFLAQAPVAADGVVQAIVSSLPAFPSAAPAAAIAALLHLQNVSTFLRKGLAPRMVVWRLVQQALRAQEARCVLVAAGSATSW